MPIVGLAVVGGVVGIAVYDNYSDWGEYSEYTEYSDAAERRKRRKEQKQKEIDAAVEQLNEYKKNNVDCFLTDPELKNQNGERVSVVKMDQNVKRNINEQIESRVNKETEEIQNELKEIDRLLQLLEE